PHSHCTFHRIEAHDTPRASMRLVVSFHGRDTLPSHVHPEQIPDRRVRKALETERRGYRRKTALEEAERDTWSTHSSPRDARAAHDTRSSVRKQLAALAFGHHHDAHGNPGIGLLRSPDP